MHVAWGILGFSTNPQDTPDGNLEFHMNAPCRIIDNIRVYYCFMKKNHTELSSTDHALYAFLEKYVPASIQDNNVLFFSTNEITELLSNGLQISSENIVNTLLKENFEMKMIDNDGEELGLRWVVKLRDNQ